MMFATCVYIHINNKGYILIGTLAAEMKKHKKLCEDQSLWSLCQKMYTHKSKPDTSNPRQKLHATLHVVNRSTLPVSTPMMQHQVKY